VATTHEGKGTKDKKGSELRINPRKREKREVTVKEKGKEHNPSKESP